MEPNCVLKLFCKMSFSSGRAKNANQSALYELTLFCNLLSSGNQLITFISQVFGGLPCLFQFPQVVHFVNSLSLFPILKIIIGHFSYFPLFFPYYFKTTKSTLLYMQQKTTKSTLLFMQQQLCISCHYALMVFERPQIIFGKQGISKVWSINPKMVMTVQSKLWPFVLCIYSHPK